MLLLLSALTVIIFAVLLCLELQLAYIQFRPIDSVNWRYHWHSRWWWCRPVRLVAYPFLFSLALLAVQL